MHRTTFPRLAARSALLVLSLAACGDAALAPAASPALSAAVGAPLEVPPLAWRPLRGPDAVAAFAVTADGTVLAGDDLAGLWRSTDDGSSWTRVESFPADAGILDLAADVAGPVWAATTLGVMRSHDGGASWVPAGLEDKWVTALAVSDDGGVYAGAGGWSGGVFRSTDGGLHWTQIVPSVNPREFIINFLTAYKGDLFVGTHADNILRSFGFGESWDWGTIQFADGYLPSPHAMVVTEQATQLVALPAGIFRSEDGERWTPAFDETGVIAMTRDARGAVLALGYDHVVRRSVDDGRSWTPISVRVNADYGRAFIATPSGRLLVGGFEGVWGTVR